MDPKIYFIPLSILCDYLKPVDLIKLSKYDDHFRKYIYLNIKPSLTINNIADGITFIKFFKNAKIELICNKKINNDDLKQLPEISSIILSESYVITHTGMNYLTNLTNLNVSYGSFAFGGKYNNKVSNLIANLTNLTSLNLNNNEITNGTLQKLTKLVTLNFTNSTTYLNAGIDNLINLTSLTLNKDYQGPDRPDDGLTDFALKNLSNLEYLNLKGNNCATDDGISHLINLKTLNIYRNSKITNNGIKNLINLTDLNVGTNRITDDGLDTLKNLTCLDISSTNTISIDALMKLPKLIKLKVAADNIICDSELNKLVNLTSLRISWARTNCLNPSSIDNLTGLTQLNLKCNYDLSDLVLKNLMNLKSLKMYMNKSITDEQLKQLVNLEALDLCCNEQISDSGVATLTKLRSLNLNSNYGEGGAIRITPAVLKNFPYLEYLRVPTFYFEEHQEILDLLIENGTEICYVMLLRNGITF